MQMKMQDGRIYIRNPDAGQRGAIKSWGLLTWNRSCQWWEGFASIDLLDRLAKLVRLPAEVQAERDRLKEVQALVDEERNRAPEEVKPLTHYPVKQKLYIHQTRAANMALITFGVITPDDIQTKGGTSK